MNLRGAGVKKAGYVLLTMDAIDRIIAMADKVTEMDAYLDLILHAVVRDQMVEFSEFPVVCFPDSWTNIRVVPKPGENRNPYDRAGSICYEPCIRNAYLAKRWKVAKNTVTVRLSKFIRLGMLTKVTFSTHLCQQMSFLFVPDAMITGDKSSMEAIGNIDEDFIWYEAEQHMEDDDYACGEHKVIEGTLRIMTKENPKGEKKSDMDVVPVSAHCENIQSGESLFLSSLGKSGRSNGAKIFAKMFVKPLSTAIFIIPDQRQIMPAIVRISCIDDAPLSMSAFEMSAVLPINNAHNTLTAMSPLQI